MRNFSKEDGRLEMVLRATTVSKKNFKEAEIAKKNYAIEFLLLSYSQLLGGKRSDWKELNDLIKRSFDLETSFNLKIAQLLLELVYTVLPASICVDKHLPASVRCQK